MCDCHSLCHFLLVCDSLYHFMVVCHSLCHFMLVCHSFCHFMLVCHSLCHFMFVCHSLCYFLLVSLTSSSVPAWQFMSLHACLPQFMSFPACLSQFMSFYAWLSQSILFPVCLSQSVLFPACLSQLMFTVTVYVISCLPVTVYVISCSSVTVFDCLSLKLLSLWLVDGIFSFLSCSHRVVLCPRTVCPQAVVQGSAGDRKGVAVPELRWKMWRPRMHHGASCQPAVFQMLLIVSKVAVMPGWSMVLLLRWWNLAVERLQATLDASRRVITCRASWVITLLWV